MRSSHDARTSTSAAEKAATVSPPPARAGGQGEAPLSHSQRRKGHRRRRVQLLVVEMPGAEQWFMVKHAKGQFKVPGTASVGELFVLALDGVVEAKKVKGSEAWVRISLRRLQELEKRDQFVRALDAADFRE